MNAAELLGSWIAKTAETENVPMVDIEDRVAEALEIGSAEIHLIRAGMWALDRDDAKRLQKLTGIPTKEWLKEAHA